MIRCEVEQPRKHSDSSTLVEIAQPPPIIEEEDEDIVFKPLNQTHPVVKTRKDSQEDDDGSELGSQWVQMFEFGGLRPNCCHLTKQMAKYGQFEKGLLWTIICGGC